MKLDNRRIVSTAKRSLIAAFGLAVSLLASTVAPAMQAQAAPTNANASAPANAPASYTCLYYTVKRGDQLLRIAIRYGTTTEILMRVNGMRTNRVYIGQRLCIPRNTPPPKPPPPGPGPQPGAGHWYGEYWNNTSQSGAPSLARNDAALNFNWGYGTPDAGRVFSDNFSARWTRTIASTGGVYRFTVTHDDGIRLYVDGNLVLEKYDFVGNATNTVDVPLGAGNKVIRLDYVERSGIALVRLNYFRVTAPAPPPQPPAGGAWRADFYNNRDLAGAPVYVANYGSLNFSWGTNSPGGSVPADNWSARFTQLRYFNAGTYRFIASSDDGVRVYVDDVLVVNNWREQAYATASGDINLGAGNHYIRVEYFDAGAQATLSLYIDQR
jgi:LysM repeat protein